MRQQWSLQTTWPRGTLQDLQVRLALLLFISQTVCQSVKPSAQRDHTDEDAEWSRWPTSARFWHWYRRQWSVQRSRKPVHPVRLQCRSRPALLLQVAG